MDDMYKCACGWRGTSDELDDDACPDCGEEVELEDQQ